MEILRFWLILKQKIFVSGDFTKATKMAQHEDLFNELWRPKLEYKLIRGDFYKISISTSAYTQSTLGNTQSTPAFTHCTSANA